ncbi:MAG: aminotransferase class V-fold PLP-dependent enzyme, partial [Bacillota bacterium]
MCADSFNYDAPPLYLDGAATSKPHHEIVEEVGRCMRELYANPSSPHRLGVEAETTMEHARRRIARLLRVDPRGIYFNSGATEGNNTVIRGVADEFRNRGNHVLITGVEHPSVYEPCRNLRERGFEVDVVRPEADGRVSPEDFARALREDTILVSTATVSGEVGAVQPLEEFAASIRALPRPHPIFHTDAVQGLGRIPLDVE